MPIQRETESDYEMKAKKLAQTAKMHQNQTRGNEAFMSGLTRNK